MKRKKWIRRSLLKRAIAVSLSLCMTFSFVTSGISDELISTSNIYAEYAVTLNDLPSDSGLQVNPNDKVININSSNGFIYLSNADPAEYEDYKIICSNNAGANGYHLSSTNNGLVYQGLGSTEHPFKGKFSCEYKIYLYNASLFNCIDTDAEIEYCLQIGTRYDSESFLLADTVKATDSSNELTAEIKIIEECQNFGGIVGTAEENARISLSVENNVDVQTRYEKSLIRQDMSSEGEHDPDNNGYLTAKIKNGDAGFFCGRMKKGSSLNVSYTGKEDSYICVNTEDGNAGLLVGSAEDAEINISSNMAIKGKVIASQSAGGAVGVLERSSVTFGNENDGSVWLGLGVDSSKNIIAEKTVMLHSADNKDSKKETYYGLSVEGGTCSGGFAGRCVYNKDTDLDPKVLPVINVSFNTSSQYCGGLFGKLENKGENKISLTGISDNLNIAVIKGTNYGGFAGAYSADKQKASLEINNVVINEAVSSTGNNNGGIIGIVSEDTTGSAFVKVSNAVVNCNGATLTGGIIGKSAGSDLLDISDVTVNGGTCSGGIVGSMDKGALRLSGKTDLSTVIFSAGADKGQILGKRGNTLVYALPEWKMIRAAGKKYSVSDIGTWGQVVRLDREKLEESDKFIEYNTTDHTVTIHGIKNSIDSLRDFAALSLALSCRNTDDVLKFENNSVIASYNDTNIYSGGISVNSDIDLSGTGITGLMRDDGTQIFSGTLNGNGRTVTMSTGELYGFIMQDGQETDISAYLPEKSENAGYGQIYNHLNSGLFAEISDASINNITLNGMICIGTSIEKNVYSGAVSAMVSGTENSLEHIVSNTNIMLLGSGDKKIVFSGGLVGAVGKPNNTADGDISADMKVSGCIWNSKIDNYYTEKSVRSDNPNAPYYIGGFAGIVYGASDIEITGSEINGKIINHNYAASGNAGNHVGGLIAEFRRSTNESARNKTDLKHSVLKIDGLKVSVTIDNGTGVTQSGGFLGYEWWNCDASFDNIEISDSELITGGNFGGLVYYGSGYWNVGFNDNSTGKGISFTERNKIKGSSENDDPSAVFVAHTESTENDTYYDLVDPGKHTTDKQLYLEINYNSSDKDFSYSIKESALTLELSSKDVYFDEIAGTTIGKYGNGVVSLHTDSGKVDDGDNGNTYKAHLTNKYNNALSRYYYNLDICRDPSENTLTDGRISTAEEMMCYSLAKYTRPYLRGYFALDNNSSDANLPPADPSKITITETIDLSGYSYYPIDMPDNVIIKDAVITFGNASIEEKEADNKKTTDSKKQHYMMQTGLILNTNSDISVESSEISGTVGKITEDAKSNIASVKGSGALVCGKAEGKDNSTGILNLSVSGLVLDGLRVTGFSAADDYFPLLINKIGKYSKVTISSLSTKGYNDDENQSTADVATSLLGNVGSEDADYINLIFKDIALDGRVNDNTAVSENYSTYSSIFSRAVLMDSFRYKGSNSSGKYNFTSTDKAVYCVEISNTDSGRNPDNQKLTFDGKYVVDTMTGISSENDPGFYTKDENGKYVYLRYVLCNEGYNNDSTYHEIDINQKGSDLKAGCGTYDEPFIITSGEQLESLAKYFRGQPDDGWTVNFDINTLEKQSGSAHNSDAHYMYDLDQKKWKDSEDKSADGINIKVTQYLRNAYYLIEGKKDEETGKNKIVLGEDFVGIGSDDIRYPTDVKIEYSFCGVIEGKKDNEGNNPQVYITAHKGDTTKYGGLVQYASGCVIKDIDIVYDEGEFTFLSEIPGNGVQLTDVETPAAQKPENQRFFGGVIGYAFGGDNIIDNVNVSGLDKRIVLTGEYDYLANIGGYVGLVGGNALNGGYGGGVVFRNISENEMNFDVYIGDKDKTASSGSEADHTVYTEADGKYYDAVINTTILKKEDQYFYINPFVGRVLDGYACSENAGTEMDHENIVYLKNTDKNYSIPQLWKGDDNKLSIDSNYLNINNEQSLWLTSAIVNSGAGSMGESGYSQYAYKYGKVRSGAYSASAITNDPGAVNDEMYWGGYNTETNSSKTSYLVAKYGLSEENLSDETEEITETIDVKVENKLGTSFAFGNVDTSNNIYSVSLPKSFYNTIYALAKANNNEIIKIAIDPQISDKEIKIYFINSSNGTDNISIVYRFNDGSNYKSISGEESLEIDVDEIIKENNISNADIAKLYVAVSVDGGNLNYHSGNAVNAMNLLKELGISVSAFEKESMVIKEQRLNANFKDANDLTGFINNDFDKKKLKKISKLYNTPDNTIGNYSYKIIDISSCDRTIEIVNQSDQDIYYYLINTIDKDKVTVGDITMGNVTISKNGGKKVIDNDDFNSLIIGCLISKDPTINENFLKKVTVKMNGEEFVLQDYSGQNHYSNYGTDKKLLFDMEDDASYLYLSNLRDNPPSTNAGQQKFAYKMLKLEDNISNVNFSAGNYTVNYYIIDLGRDDSLSVNDVILKNGSFKNTSVDYNISTENRKRAIGNLYILITINSNSFSDFGPALKSIKIIQTTFEKDNINFSFDCGYLDKYKCADQILILPRPKLDTSKTDNSKVYFIGKGWKDAEANNQVTVRINQGYQAGFYITSGSNLNNSAVLYEYNGMLKNDISDGEVTIDLESVRKNYDLPIGYSLYVVVEFYNYDLGKFNFANQFDKAMEQLYYSDFEIESINSNGNMTFVYSYEEFITQIEEMRSHFSFSTDDYNLTNWDLKQPDGVSPQKRAYFDIISLCNDGELPAKKIFISNLAASYEVKYSVINNQEPSMASYYLNVQTVAKNKESGWVDISAYDSEKMYLLTAINISSSVNFFKAVNSGYKIQIYKSATVIGFSLNNLSNPKNYKNIQFWNNCNMIGYGNGFRGIGTGYTDNVTKLIQERTINLSKINGNGHTIIISRNGNEYSEDTWWTQAEGLFPVYFFSHNPSEVKDLKISGNVIIYYADKVYLANAHKNRQKKYKSGSTTYEYTPYDSFIGEACLGIFGGMSAYNNNTPNINNAYIVAEGAQLNQVSFVNVRVENSKVEGGKYCGGFIGAAGQINHVYRMAWYRGIENDPQFSWSNQFYTYNPKTVGSLVGNYVFDSCGYTTLEIKAANAVGGIIGNIKNNANSKAQRSVKFKGETLINGVNKFELTRDAIYDYVSHTTVPYNGNDPGNNVDNAGKYYCYVGGGGLIGYCDSALYICNYDSNSEKEITAINNLDSDNYCFEESLDLDGLTITAPQISFNTDYGLGVICGTVNQNGGSSSKNPIMVCNVKITNSSVGTPKNDKYWNVVRGNDEYMTYPFIGKEDEIIHPSYRNYNAGGIFGYAKSKTYVYNCMVKDSIIINSPYAGGIVANKANENLYILKTSVKDCLIYNTDVVATSRACGVGGLVGHLNHISYIMDCEVSGCTLISNGSTGAIAGYTGNEVTVKNILIENNKIVSTRSYNEKTLKTYKDTTFEAVKDVSGGFKIEKSKEEDMSGINGNSDAFAAKVGGVSGGYSTANAKLYYGYNITFKDNLIGYVLDENQRIYSYDESQICDFNQAYPSRDMAELRKIKGTINDYINPSNVGYINQIKNSKATYMPYTNSEGELNQNKSGTEGFDGIMIGYMKSDSGILLTGVTVQGDYLPSEYNGNGNQANANSYIIRSDYTGSGIVKDNEDENGNNLININTVLNSVTGAANVSGTTMSPEYGRYGTYATSNPYINIPLYREDGETFTEYLTSDGISKSAIEKIIADAKTPGSDPKVYSSKNNELKTIADNFTNPDKYSKKLLMYSDLLTDQEKQNNPDITDFPVILIDTNDSSEIDSMLQSYISLMTGTYQTKAASTAGLNTQKQYLYSNVEIVTYEYKDSSWRAKPDSADSLAITGSGIKFRFRNRPGMHDNDNANPQFTLIDVQYNSPVTGETSKVAYHLYIPVFVKRVMPFAFFASCLNDTNYYPDAYENNRIFVLSNFGDKVTARLSYNYYRSADEWNSLIAGGEDLLWNFNKRVYLGDKPLPKGTVLKLVDINNSGKTYRYELDGNKLSVDLSDFTEGVGISGSWKEDALYLCDLLKPYALKKDAPDPETENLTGYFVRTEATDSRATVRCRSSSGEYVYYRLAEAADLETEDLDYYSVMVDGSVIEKQPAEGLDKSNLLIDSKGEVSCLEESYFLTIETPSGINDLISNNIEFSENSLGSGGCGYINRPADFTMPTVKANGSLNGARVYSRNKSESRYIISNGISLDSASVATRSIAESNIMSSDNNSIRVEMTDRIVIKQNKIKDYFSLDDEYVDLYQNFDLNIMEILGSSRQIKPFSNNSDISYMYEVYDAKEWEDYKNNEGADMPAPLFRTSSGKITASDKLILNYREAEADDGFETDSGKLVKMLQEHSENGLTVRCIVDIGYSDDGIEEQFIESLLEGSDDDGARFIGNARLSYSESSIDTSSMTKRFTDSQTYYRSKITHSKITYNSLNITDGDATGIMGVGQFGINPSDAVNNPDIVRTYAYYDISSVADEDLAKSDRISYTVSLYRKDDNGNYSEECSIIDNNDPKRSFLKNVEIDGIQVNDISGAANGTGPQIFSKDGGKTISYIKPIGEAKEKMYDELFISFLPETGDNLEASGHFYSNYKVKVEAKLLYKADSMHGIENVPNSDCDDYIIYTNARIKPEIYPDKKAS